MSKEPDKITEDMLPLTIVFGIIVAVVLLSLLQG